MPKVSHKIGASLAKEGLVSKLHSSERFATATDLVWVSAECCAPERDLHIFD